MTQWFFGIQDTPEALMKGFGHTSNRDYQVGIFEDEGRIGFEVRILNDGQVSDYIDIDVTERLSELIVGLEAARDRIGA